ncbi:MAG: sulfurtransferase TusA family protein [Armatimonadota bacterium]
MANTDLDCRGLACPMPIVRISRAFKELATGDTLTVRASDPSFRADAEAWARRMGQALESLIDRDGEQTALFRKTQ